jgi:hypothetical protein
MNQPDLFAAEPRAITDADISDLRAHLIMSPAWLSRSDLCARTGWPDRKVRAVAQALGNKIIRSHQGYKLTDNATADDVAAIRQTLHTFKHQAEEMESYADALRIHPHVLELLTGPKPV